MHQAEEQGAMNVCWFSFKFVFKYIEQHVFFRGTIREAEGLSCERQIRRIGEGTVIAVDRRTLGRLSPIFRKAAAIWQRRFGTWQRGSAAAPHSGRPSSPGGTCAPEWALTEEETKDAVLRHKYILAMKEELFNEIVQFRQEYYISKLHSWNSEMLLYPLSLGLKPRPGDTFRKMCQRNEIMNRVFWVVGIFVTIDMVAKGLSWCIIKAVQPEEKEQLENKENMMVSSARV